MSIRPKFLPLVLLPLVLFASCDSATRKVDGFAEDPSFLLYDLKEGERKELPNGLIVEEVKLGDGDPVGPFSKTKINYTGRLTDGTEFDSSRKPTGDTPFELNLMQPNAIKGWIIGVRGMKKGGQRKLTIPPSLAYGEAGSPPRIPANATLVFDLELIGLE